MLKTIVLSWGITALMMSAVSAPAAEVRGRQLRMQEVQDARTSVKPRHRFAIRNEAGRCLDVHLPELRQDGGRVQVWHCTGRPQQRWIWLDGAIVSWGGKCLDVHAPDMNRNGARIQVWECNGRPQQRWTLKDGAIVNDSGMCLDLHAPDMHKDGGRVQLWACNGQTQQTWRVGSAEIPGDRLAVEIARVEGELKDISDDAQLANIDLQSNMQKTQQMMNMLSEVSRRMNETRQNTIRNMK